MSTAVLRYLRILEGLGLPKIERPVFPLPPGDPLNGPFRDQPPFVVLHPFARGEGKSLAPERVDRVLRTRAADDAVVAGRRKVERELPGNTINLLNQTTIRQMIWLLGAAAFVVSVDSGPMHIAAALNAKMLSIHTWSDPRLVGPFSGDAWIWQGGQIRRQQIGAPSLSTCTRPRMATTSFKSPILSGSSSEEGAARAGSSWRPLLGCSLKDPEPLISRC